MPTQQDFAQREYLLHWLFLSCEIILFSMHTHLKVIETNKEKHPLRMPSPPKQLPWLVWQSCFPTSFPCVMHTWRYRQWCKSLLQHGCAFVPYPIFLLCGFFSSLPLFTQPPPSAGPATHPGPCWPQLPWPTPPPSPAITQTHIWGEGRGLANIRRITSPCQPLTFITKTITSFKISPI